MDQLPYTLAEDASPALTQAWLIAMQAGLREVTPECLLLGVLQTPACQAVQTLTKMGIALDRIQQETQALLRRTSSTGLPAGMEMHLSADGRDVFLEASREAKLRGVDALNTTMIVMGLLRIQRLAATEVLRRHSLTLLKLRERLDYEQQQLFFQNRPSVSVTRGATPAAPQPASRPRPAQPVQSRPSPAARPTATGWRPRSILPARSRTRTFYILDLPLEISPVFLGLLGVTLLSALLSYTGWFLPRLFVFLFVTGGWITTLCLHEFGHAAVAYWGGDYSVADKGYLTLNPLRYTNWLFSILFPVLMMIAGGIGLPGGAVYVNPFAIRTAKMRSLTSAAGPLMSGTAALVLSLPFFFVDVGQALATHPEFWSGLALLAMLQVTAVFFNLLPIPPLDGFGILAPYLPEEIVRIGYQFGQFAFFLVFFLFATNSVFARWFWELVTNALSLLHVDPMLISLGFQFFRFWQR